MGEVAPKKVSTILAKQNQPRRAQNQTSSPRRRLTSTPPHHSPAADIVKRRATENLSLRLWPLSATILGWLGEGVSFLPRARSTKTALMWINVCGGNECMCDHTNFNPCNVCTFSMKPWCMKKFGKPAKAALLAATGSRRHSTEQNGPSHLKGYVLDFETETTQSNRQRFAGLTPTPSKPCRTRMVPNLCG
jgi:hypothetical protein